MYRIVYLRDCHKAQLCIVVTKRPVHQADQLANLVRLGVDSVQVDNIVQTLSPAGAQHRGTSLFKNAEREIEWCAGWESQKRKETYSNDLLSVGQILQLPDRPSSVDHGMVKPCDTPSQTPKTQAKTREEKDKKQKKE